jgi:hypothetical protein
MHNRGSVTVVSVYAAIVAALIGSIAIALAVVGSSVASLPSARTKSAFETQLESAREIREALAKPVPQPERLGPITSKPAKVAGAKSAPKKQTHDVASRQSRQAFANIHEPRQPQEFFGFLSFAPDGRH